ncbi:sensor histidine kinase [Paenibacillus algorifonticola]|uniref:ATP-binding protein n=1 Tax=Paenibacillus algorifonticola TaxID=684063 RepID=UPI003D2D5877
MRLFWRDHLALLLLQPVIIGVVLLICWLDGYRNGEMVLYAAFLGALLFAAYLCFRYVTHREYYKRLASQPATLDEGIEALDQAPAPQALQQLLLSHYQLLQQQLTDSQQQQNTHQLFMNQWVHQMKTPLAVIELTLQQEPAAPYTSSIREETDRLRTGLETVLYAARLQSFEHDFHIRLVSLAVAADQAVHECKRLFIRSLVYPLVKGDKSLQVRTDEKWLVFIIVQLLTNAIKYSAGEHKKVELTLGEQGGQAVLEVRDEGIGISRADIRRVFEPFYTGANGRRYRESTGMGLYLVKQACDHLQHEVELVSAPGEGTAVRLLFPSWQRGGIEAPVGTGRANLTPM